MGISTHIYCVYGVKIPWDDAFSDAHELVYNDEDLPDLIFDGMGGDYVVLGKILYDSGDFRWGFENGDVAKTIDVAALPSIEQAYRRQFAQKFPDFVGFLNQPFQLQVFMHLS